MIPSGDLVLANVVFPLLLVLALMLPFEATRPLFHLGPFGVTSVELPLYALIGASLVQRDAWRMSTWTPVHWAAIAWAGAHLASAAAAEGDRTLAFHFAMRMSVGAALVFPVAATTGTPRRAVRVFQALVVGAALSAAMAVAEVLLPGAAPLLGYFKTTSAHVGDVIRAGGPFQYPNPAALYWGAALLVLLVIDGWPGGGGDPHPIRWPTVTAGVLLVTAMVASGSRGAIIATMIVLGLLAAIAPVRSRRVVLAALALLGASALLAALLRPSLILRDSSALGEDPWFAGQFALLGPAPPMVAGRSAAVRVQARNVGVLPWQISGPMPMSISARWLDAEGRIAHEEPATPLPIPVPRGSAVVVELEVTAPERPGRYAVRWQLVGGGTSFDAPADASRDSPIEVIGDTAPARVWPAPRPTQRQVTRRELWRAGWRMWRERPVLGVGPDGFRQLYGRYLGPRTLDARVNANSLYVETLADLGLVGAVALLLVFTALAKEALPGCRKLSGSGRGLILGSTAALLAFALHGVVDSVSAFTSLHGLFWIHAGLLAGKVDAFGVPNN